jgi:hypothetical protein
MLSLSTKKSLSNNTITTEIELLNTILTATRNELTYQIDVNNSLSIEIKNLQEIICRFLSNKLNSEAQSKTI